MNAIVQYMKMAKLSGYSYGLPPFPLFIFSISSLYSFQFLFSGILSPRDAARRYIVYGLCHKAGFGADFLIFYTLVAYLRRLGVRIEVETMSTVTSVVVTGIFLGATLAVLLPFVRFEVATFFAVFMLGIYVALLKRDVIKVILGILLSANALYPALALLELPFSIYLVFDVTEILVTLVMLWVALLIKERYGALDGWKANLLRW